MSLPWSVRKNMSLDEETYYQCNPGLYEEQIAQAQAARDSFHQARFLQDQLDEQEQRRETLTSKDVLEFAGIGVTDYTIVLNASRKGAEPWGRGWLVHTTFQNNTFGVIKAGSLIESRGKVDATMAACCMAIENEKEEEPGVAGEIRILTYRPKMRGA